MNMFAKFDENSAKTFQDIKETKCYGQMDVGMDGSTDGQCEKQYTHHKQSLKGV